MIVKIPKEYFLEQHVKDCEDDSDFALDVLVLYEGLVQHFESSPEINPNLPIGEA